MPAFNRLLTVTKRNLCQFFRNPCQFLAELASQAEVCVPSAKKSTLSAALWRLI
jgi:hypothetical protein